MSHGDPLQREEAILLEIIRYYLDTHEAISARTLSKISELALSPTTIRNLMEDLSSAGLLTNEGVTRGRIPTQKAFSVYVTRLREHEPPPRAERPHLQPAEEGSRTGLQRDLEEVGAYLVRQSGLVALAALPPQGQFPMEWVRFAALPQNRILVSLMTMFGDLWSKVLQAAEPLEESLLQEVSRYLNDTYRGRHLDAVRGDIMAGEPRALLSDVGSLGAAVRTLRRAFEWETTPGWHVWGQDNLLRVREFADPALLLALNEALRRPSLMQQVRGRAVAVEGGWACLGTEMGLSGLEEAAVVGHPFGVALESGVQWEGQLAVFGPLRMNYALVLAHLSQAARLLSEHLAQMARGAAT